MTRVHFFFPLIRILPDSYMLPSRHTITFNEPCTPLWSSCSAQKSKNLVYTPFFTFWLKNNIYFIWDARGHSCVIKLHWNCNSKRCLSHFLKRPNFWKKTRTIILSTSVVTLFLETSKLFSLHRCHGGLVLIWPPFSSKLKVI